MMELPPQHKKMTKKILKQNSKINCAYQRCICRYCNSIAIKKMFMDQFSSFFVCEQCVNNIIRSKMLICNDPDCIFPAIRDIDLKKFFIMKHIRCSVCDTYSWHLQHGYETHFTSMDFSLSYWDLVTLTWDNVTVDDRVKAVHKYLQFKGFH